MGEFADYLKKNNLSGDLVTAVGAAEDIYGTVSGAYAYYGAAKSLGAQLGLWKGEKDGFERLAESIEHLEATMIAGFNVVLTQMQREGQQDKLDKLVLLDNDRLGAIATLVTYGQSGLSAGQLEDLQSQSHAEGYKESSIWTLVFYPNTVYSDTWAGKIAPPNDGVSYAAFTPVLPRYLRAIAIRLTCLTVIFKQPFGDGREQEMRAYAERIREIHDLMTAAISVHRPPTLAEVTPIPREPINPMPGNVWYVHSSFWESRGRLYGSVEPYSALADVAEYPEPEPKPPNAADYPVPGERLPEYAPPPNPNEPDYQRPDTSAYRIAFDAWRKQTLEPYYQRFIVRHAARSWAARKRIYAAAGLPSLWNSMNELRRMGGEAQLLDNARSFNGAWSLREFGGVIAGARGTPLPPAAYTMRGLGSAVGFRGPPTSMRALLFADG